MNIAVGLTETYALIQAVPDGIRACVKCPAAAALIFLLLCALGS